MPKLRVGDPAPELAATAQDGRTVQLSDFRGRCLVVYFYPKAFTPGCTAQAKAFATHYEEIAALGAALVGVSVDGAPRLCDFQARHELPFTLLADADGALCSRYGVKRGLLGIAKRVTFVIDPEGVIIGRFHHELQATRHVDDVLELLRARASSTGQLATSSA